MWLSADLSCLIRIGAFSRGRMHRTGLLFAAPSAAVDCGGQRARVESTVAWGEVDDCGARPDNGLDERVEEKKKSEGCLAFWLEQFVKVWGSSFARENQLF